MTEPTIEHLRALDTAMRRRKGFRQAFDDITFVDAPEWNPDEDEWHPLQRECLQAFASAVLNASDGLNLSLPPAQAQYLKALLEGMVEDYEDPTAASILGSIE